MQSVEGVLKRYPLLDAKLVACEGEFSRGRGLQAAADAVAGVSADSVLFFCDVDMKFTVEFMRRCAINPLPGQRVYFPVPFSLYRGKGLVVGHETGEWRRFGVGMLCVRGRDFAAVGGFNTRIRGWGEEDVDLYERFVRKSGLEVMRAIDSGLVHQWHAKTCDPSLSRLQREHCLWSKMEYEGNKRQLAMQLAACRNISN